MKDLSIIIGVVLLQVLLSINSLPVPGVKRQLCPRISNFYGYEPSHVGCCINDSLCSIQLDSADPKLLEGAREIQGPAGRNKREIESHPTHHKLSKYFSLCRSNISVIVPVFATSATTHQQVQLLQLQPILTQSIVVHTCEERETPILRGYCKQHFKREAVYVVEPNFNYSRTDYGDVTFKKEYILVAAGCDLALDADFGYLDESYRLRKSGSIPELRHSSDSVPHAPSYSGYAPAAAAEPYAPRGQYNTPPYTPPEYLHADPYSPPAHVVSPPRAEPYRPEPSYAPSEAYYVPSPAPPAVYTPAPDPYMSSGPYDSVPPVKYPSSEPYSSHPSEYVPSEPHYSSAAPVYENSSYAPPPMENPSYAEDADAYSPAVPEYSNYTAYAPSYPSHSPAALVYDPSPAEYNSTRVGPYPEPYYAPEPYAPVNPSYEPNGTEPYVNVEPHQGYPDLSQQYPSAYPPLPRPEELIYAPNMEPGQHQYQNASSSYPGNNPNARPGYPNYRPNGSGGWPRGREDDVYKRDARYSNVENVRPSSAARTASAEYGTAHVSQSPPKGVYSPPVSIGKPVYSMNNDRIQSLMSRA